MSGKKVYGLYEIVENAKIFNSVTSQFYSCDMYSNDSDLLTVFFKMLIRSTLS